MSLEPNDTAIRSPAPNAPVTDPSDVLERALIQFNEITSACLDERMMALEDRRFLFIQGAQWEGDWGAQFENCLRVEINKVRKGQRKIIEDYRANRFAVNFRPVANAGADSDTADLLNGLMLADLWRSHGQQALDNAFSEGVSGGFGAWRLMNEYEDDSDPENDHQRIGVYQVADADQRVFFDLDAKLYDKSDARFAYVLNSLGVREFQRQYGEERLSTWPENRARANMFDWFRPSVVMVAEYYEVETPVEELRIFTREATDEEFRYWAKDIDEDTEADLKRRGFTLRKRRIKRRRVHKWLLTGAEVLEDCGFIAGNAIPIVPFYGDRVFIDNLERFQGHVRDAKDAQRVYNSQISKLVETASLTPREVPIFAPEQVEGLEGHWARMNIDRHPYALAYPLTDPQTGAVAAAGPIGRIEPPQMPPVLAALIEQTASDVGELTYADNEAMELKSNVSGDAMDIAASRVDAKSFVYMDNFRASMQRFGEIYYGMAKDIYVEAGRVVETMAEDGETDSAVLGELHRDPKSGITARRYDLSAGKFNVIADVTEATATRRDKTVRTMMTLAQAASSIQAPQIGIACLLTALKNMDGEGVSELKGFAHKQAVQIGLDEMTPEEQQQAAAQAQQAQMQPSPQMLAVKAHLDKMQADTAKVVADTTLSHAKAVQTLADAGAEQRYATGHPLYSPVANGAVQVPGPDGVTPAPAIGALSPERPIRPIPPVTVAAMMAGQGHGPIQS